MTPVKSILVGVEVKLILLSVFLLVSEQADKRKIEIIMRSNKYATIHFRNRHADGPPLLAMGMYFAQNTKSKKVLVTN